MTDTEKLQAVLAAHSTLTVAVSGGVDSMTLAWVAGNVAGLALLVVHATGPAVPPDATRRVRAYARKANWSYRELDAGEYADPDYRRNPSDRCYYCKHNLYRRIAEVTSAPIAAGTNLDDLGDYRPGLKAAGEHQVVHPYIDAGMDKSAVRALARHHGLTDVAELPAQPCLASRVETGISIDAADLAFIDSVEKRLSAQFALSDLRCRITGQGVWVEASDLSPGMSAWMEPVGQLVRQWCVDAGRRFAGCRPYQRGSAFLVSPAMLAQTLRRQQS